MSTPATTKAASPHTGVSKGAEPEPSQDKTTAATTAIVQKSRKVPKLKRQTRCRLAVKLAMEHPDWTGRQILLKAGYRGWTLNKPGRVLSTQTAKAHEAELRAEFREKLSAKFSLDQAVDGLAEIAKHGKVEFARLQAIDTCLEHLGVTDPHDQQQVVIVVVGMIAPLLQRYMPAESRAQFMAALEAEVIT